MTPDQIKAGHTYETEMGTRWTVISVSGDAMTAASGLPVRDSVPNFALYAVRDVTPAPESDQGEKVAQAQSQGASRGCGDGLVRKFASDVAEYLYDAGHRDDGPGSSEGTRLLRLAREIAQQASCGDGTADLTADDWLQIEMAARGCVSGTASEWPALAAAINKLRDKPIGPHVSSSWLQGFCEMLVAFRDHTTPPATDAVKDELLAVVRRFVAEWDATWVDPDDINHDWAELYRQARAAIARAEANQ